VAEVFGDEAVQLGWIGGGRLGIGDLPRRFGLARVQVADDLARERERVLVRRRVVVRYARLARVHVGAA
jgi:hypothetical protein